MADSKEPWKTEEDEEEEELDEAVSPSIPSLITDF